MIKKIFPIGWVYAKKQTWVTGNQHIFKTGFMIDFISQLRGIKCPKPIFLVISCQGGN